MTFTSSPAATTPRSRHRQNASSKLASTPTHSAGPFTPVPRTPGSAGQANMQLKPGDPVPDVSESPNYFGLAVEESKGQGSSTGGRDMRGNWSPPTSNVRSTAAASPRIIPLDQNPEFEAFRRQSEMNGYRRSSGFAMAPPGPSPVSEVYKPVSSMSSMVPPTSPRAKGSVGSPRLSEPVPRSPKRMLSSPAPHVTDRPRKASPAQFNDRDAQLAPFAMQFLSDEKDLRRSLPPHNIDNVAQLQYQRADTLPELPDGETPAGTNTSSPILVTPQRVVDVMEKHGESVLLLDLRVSTHYARSRISGALNLCIPTTLLKRPSYNLSKLADTFADEEQKQKFESWRSFRYVVVYDAGSTLLKDASGCVNMLKKFAHEGWSGYQYVIRGGFVDFSKRFPNLVAYDAAPTAQAGPDMVLADSSIAPVIGGCPMPASSTKTAANPFFGNIRQNMDLIGGVGQMALKIPTAWTDQRQDELPKWLRLAVNPTDEGKLVADKFLQIEKREQKRMQDALSGQVHYDLPGPSGPGTAKGFQIAGIEKGAKNRYNNIWPYEHSRVRLEGIRDGGCDYMNANHLHTSWSTKRYIATQGPIPATFTDFWKMVWQQDVRVIVMLTAETEGGQVKAHNYWGERRYGPYHLSFLSEHKASLEPSRIQRHREGSRDKSSFRPRSTTNPPLGARKQPQPPPPPTSNGQSPGSEQPFVIVRRFSLSYADEPFERMREITQLQYSNWPDFGAPAHPAHLLGLVEQCDAVVRASYGGSPAAIAPNVAQRPVVVHCSAGCGRTGTFCTVDVVLDLMKQQRTASRSRTTRQGTPMDMSPPKTPARQGSSQSGFNFQASRAQASNPSADGDSWMVQDDVDLIEKTVEEFRHQRLSAVQSLRQFVLCYESVLEWLVEQTPKSA